MEYLKVGQPNPLAPEMGNMKAFFSLITYENDMCDMSFSASDDELYRMLIGLMQNDPNAFDILVNAITSAVISKAEELGVLADIANG